MRLIKVDFSDPRDHFWDKTICGNPETVHGIVKTLVHSDDPKVDFPFLRDYGLSAQSFHPKLAGARAYANCFENTLQQ
ncbi:hypothetical protein ACFQ6Q_04595 [Streptomyces sp. NPDC056437]|uniref:hypothetical protein n=1 Tax=Streptomyces sp. NPDC056437 TaxID=3345816 RepID=UPI00369A017E